MIIGTAGHIDHGKSALVTALTGKAMDRLAEERRRGITIDLNFAPLELDGVIAAGIVDVPGHEDFVRTMVAGASGIDLVLLVVDAVEGIRPQTLEHLAVVEQLAHSPRDSRSSPRSTSPSRTGSTWSRPTSTERLAASPVSFGPVARVSSVTGSGIDELRERIRRSADPPIRRSDDLTRLPIDRAFALAGVGTVVTGTHVERDRGGRRRGPDRARADSRRESGRSNRTAGRSSARRRVPHGGGAGRRRRRPASGGVRPSLGGARTSGPRPGCSTPC